MYRHINLYKGHLFRSYLNLAKFLIKFYDIIRQYYLTFIVLWNYEFVSVVIVLERMLKLCCNRVDSF